MNDEVKIGYVFLHIVHCHSGIRCEVKVEEENLDQRCSVKKVFLEISQNSQENTCDRVSFYRTPFL